jgi:cytochrome c peroxidase
MSNRHNARLIPDTAYPDMWRVQWPDGRTSDMANLTRAKDAIACFQETLERKRRGRHSPRDGCTGVQPPGSGE